MMTLEDILSSLNVTMPSVTANATERLSTTPVGYGSSDELQSFLDNQQDSINAGLGDSNSKRLSAKSGSLNDVDLNGVASGVISGLNGILGIESSAKQLSQMHGDMSAYNTQMANLRSQVYATNDTIDQALSAQNYIVPRQTAESVSGLSEVDRSNGVTSATINGLRTGMEGFKLGIIPGIFTTIAGAGIGLLRGRQEADEGRKIAQSQADFANYNADMMTQNLQTNRDADINRIQSRDNAESAVHAVARGGEIQRHEYASRMIGQKNTPFRPTKQYCKGGLKVRIKVK